MDEGEGGILGDLSLCKEIRMSKAKRLEDPWPGDQGGWILGETMPGAEVGGDHPKK